MFKGCVSRYGFLLRDLFLRIKSLFHLIFIYFNRSCLLIIAVNPKIKSLNLLFDVSPGDFNNPLNRVSRMKLITV